MKLRNEFPVAAPADRTWQALLDVGRVARCLPGASLAADGDGGAYRGSLSVRLGPVTAEYRGTVRLVDADDDARVATFRAEGREARGHGTSAATITNRVEATDGGSRVVVETDMAVTGRAAQLGRGMMEEVAGRVLAEFARRLERDLAAPDGARAGAEPAAPSAPAPLDLGRALLPRLAAPAAAVVGLAVLVGLAVRAAAGRRRPRRGIVVEIRWRR
jgi:uncharacterized protein